MGRVGEGGREEEWEGWRGEREEGGEGLLAVETRRRRNERGLPAEAQWRSEGVKREVGVWGEERREREGGGKEMGGEGKEEEGKRPSSGWAWVSESLEYSVGEGWSNPSSWGA